MDLRIPRLPRQAQVGRGREGQVRAAWCGELSPESADRKELPVC